MTLWQTLTAEQKADAVRTAAGRGLSQAATGRELGTTEGAIGQLARRLGIRFSARPGRRADVALPGPAPSAWRRMTARQKEEAVRAGQGAGLGWPAIAGRHGTTAGAVAKVAGRIGLAAAARPEPAAPEAQDWAAMSRAGRLGAVREGIAQGLPASTIARRLGATRNAVIGLAFRNGLRFGQSPEGAGADAPSVQDAVALFGCDGIVRAPGVRTLTADLWEAFVLFCRAHDLDILPRSTFEARFARLGYSKGCARVGKRRGMAYSGIRPRADGTDEIAATREGFCSPAALPAATGAEDPSAGSDPPAVAGRTGPRPAPNSPAVPSPEAAGEPEPGAPAAFPENGVRPAPDPAMPEAAPRERGPAGGKRLMELVFGDCRFPLWGAVRPAFGEMRFCGAAVVPGKAWCPEHHTRCVVGKAEVPKAVLDVARAAGRRAGR